MEEKALKKKKGFSIATKLTALAIIPALAVTIILVLFAKYSLTNGLEGEAVDGLEFLAHATMSGYDEIEGDYSLNASGELLKGKENLSKNQEGIDKYTDGYDSDVTLFYGKTRKVTSLFNTEGQRIINTDADDAVWEKVSKGETYSTTDIEINNKAYAAVYIPLKNSDGSVVGMVFAGEPKEEIDSFTWQKVMQFIIIAIVALVAVAVIGVLFARTLSKFFVQIRDLLVRISTGDLNVTVSKKLLARTDEVGEMGHASENLVMKLKEIVTKLKASAGTVYDSGNNLEEMAGQSSSAADEISRAVEDISKGAMSQAEEISNASVEVAQIGELIEQIVTNVHSLKRASDNMNKAGDTSTQTMGDLTQSNDRTTAAINNIGKQIDTTNTSVGQISEAASLITNITTQTKLLALNASIESARAGEAGKGFAVVATEIQNLAAQSEDAANEIQNIIDSLQAESEKTMEAMEETKGLVNEQQGKLNDTKKSFQEVSEGIEVSKAETDNINSNVESCDVAKTKIVDIISNLSAISEENAASAEETTASMEELNATINVLADTAKDLKTLAQALNEDMSFFKLEE